MATSAEHHSSSMIKISYAITFPLAIAWIVLNGLFLGGGTRFTSTTSALEPGTDFYSQYSGVPILQPFSVASFTFQRPTYNGTIPTESTFRETYYLSGLYVEDLTIVPHASGFIWRGPGRIDYVEAHDSNPIFYAGVSIATYDSSNPTYLLAVAAVLLGPTLVWAPCVVLGLIRRFNRETVLTVSKGVAVLTGVALVLQAAAAGIMQQWVDSIPSYYTGVTLSNKKMGDGLAVAWAALGLGVIIALLELWAAWTFVNEQSALQSTTVEDDMKVLEKI